MNKARVNGPGALRCIGVAALIVLATSASIAFGQLARDPVLNHALRQAAGMRSYGDMLMDLANSAADVVRTSAELTGRINTARTRYWNAFPDGSELPEARLQFERLLASKDRVYLSSAITGGAGGAVMQLLGANVDGGIHPGAADAFRAWAEAVRHNLAAEGPDLTAVFLRGATQADIAKFKESIDRADPLYKAYVVRRELEEFRMQDKTPPGWDAEAWRLAMLQWRTAEDVANVGDPYGEALSVVERGAGFPRQCAAQLQTIFAGAKSTSCGCLHQLFTSSLGPRDLWQLETNFSAEQLIAGAVRKVGLHEKVAACIQ